MLLFTLCAVLTPDLKDVINYDGEVCPLYRLIRREDVNAQEWMYELAKKEKVAVYEAMAKAFEMLLHGKFSDAAASYDQIWAKQSDAWQAGYSSEFDQKKVPWLGHVASVLAKSAAVGTVNYMEELMRETPEGASVFGDVLRFYK